MPGTIGHVLCQPLLARASDGASPDTAWVQSELSHGLAIRPVVQRRHPLIVLLLRTLQSCKQGLHSCNSLRSGVARAFAWQLISM